MSTAEQASVTIRLNGEERVLPQNTDVATLLDQLGLDPTAVVVEVDGEILSHEDHPETTLRNDSHVEIVHFVGGG